ncbi:UNVERIFIED_ORG: type I restriction enzyme S subunit [Arthrobacter sp. UYEF10]
MYTQIGMLNFGRGTFKKPDLLGAETKYKTMQRVRAGQVIYSKLKAFEGALSIVPAEHDQHYVSQEFPTFDLNPNDVDTAFILQVFRSEPFADQLAQGSKGVGARRERLHPTAFLNIEIPLPSIEEQRRIVARIQGAERPSLYAVRAEGEMQRGFQSYLALMYSSLPRTSALSEVLHPRGDWKTVETGANYSTIGLSKSGRGAFVKPGLETKATRLRALRAGDFVYSRLFAWQGSMALVPDTPGNLFASNEFPSFEVDQSKALPDYLIGWFRLPALWAEIETLCTGSTPGSRNRFKEGDLLRLKMPLPELSRQRKIVESLEAFGRGRALASRRSNLAQALPKAVRNEIFSKLV